MGTLLFLLGTAMVAVTAALAACCLRLRSAVGFLLASYLLATGEIVVTALVLSTGRWLTRGALLAALVATLAVAVLLWARLGRPRQPLGVDALRALRDAGRDPAVAAIAALAAIANAYLLAGALTVPQSLPDTMLYHLPRAALWKQQHAVAYVADAPDERINVFPPGAEIESMFSMVLSGGDRYVGLAQLAALLFTSIAIVGVSRRLGLNRGAALFAALVFATFTVVVLQAPTALNDLVVASMLISCAYFAMGTTRTELTLAAYALALALGTKGTAVFALPALALFALSSQPRRRWASLGLFGVVGVAVGSFWFLVNFAQTRRLDGGVVLDRGSDSVLERMRLSVVDLLEMSDAEGEGLLTSPFWGLSVFVLALVGAAALAARRKWRASGVAVVAGAIAFAVLPLLSIWARVGGHVFEQARVAVGFTDVSSVRLPDGFYESPMHSSYGLAFVVLYLGAGALATVDVARRRLTVAALVAIGAVPFTLLVTVLALAYDPQRMRYIVFPVALATTVFGLALRVRMLAWTAIVLTVLGVVVSLGYFAPRPGGLVLLPGNRGQDRTARWLVQSEGGNGDPEAFRFVEQEIPGSATLAFAVERNTYLYPAWDAGLRRTVLFVPGDGMIPSEAQWLIVGPGKDVDVDGLSRSGWRSELATPGGWRIFRR